MLSLRQTAKTSQTGILSAAWCALFAGQDLTSIEAHAPSKRDYMINPEWGVRAV